MNRRKENANKGFSLVELIIVVAIMAVLVGVLAPQYIKYVEKARVSADASMTDEFVKAMEVLASDVDVTLDTTATTYTVTSAANSTSITIHDDLKALFNTAGSVDTAKTYSYKSSSYKTPAITLQLKYEGNMWKVVKTGVPTT